MAILCTNVVVEKDEVSGKEDAGKGRRRGDDDQRDLPGGWRSEGVLLSGRGGGGVVVVRRRRTGGEGGAECEAAAGFACRFASMQSVTVVSVQYAVIPYTMYVYMYMVCRDAEAR